MEKKKKDTANLVILCCIQGHRIGMHVDLYYYYATKHCKRQDQTTGDDIGIDLSQGPFHLF